MNIPDEDLFSEIAVGCTVSYFVQIIGCSRCFEAPSSFEAVYCFICGRQRVEVPRYRIVCLVLDPQGIKSTGIPTSLFDVNFSIFS